MLGRAVSGSAVDGLHAARRVALTGGDPGRGDLVDGGEVFITERDVHCGDVLLQVGDPPGARDRDDVRALGKHPGKGELAGRHALAFGDGHAIPATRAAPWPLRSRTRWRSCPVPITDGLPSPSANAHPGTGLSMCLRQRRLGCLLARPTKRDCFGRARTWSSLLPVTSATDDPTPTHGRVRLLKTQDSSIWSSACPASIELRIAAVELNAAQTVPATSNTTRTVGPCRCSSLGIPTLTTRSSATACTPSGPTTRTWSSAQISSWRRRRRICRKSAGKSSSARTRSIASSSLTRRDWTFSSLGTYPALAVRDSREDILDSAWRAPELTKPVDSLPKGLSGAKIGQAHNACHWRKASS